MSYSMDATKTGDKPNGFTFTRKTCWNVVMLLVLDYASLEVGSAFAAMGTSLVDLGIHFQMSLGEVSGYLLALGLSGVLASLLSPPLIKRCHVLLLLTAARLCQGVALLMIVATSYSSIATVSIFVLGFCCAITSNGAVYVCNVLFPEHNFALHSLMMSMSLGKFISPLIAEPFLIKDTIETNSSETIQDYSPSNISHDQHSPGASDSLIYFFAVLAAMTLPSTFAFSAMYITGVFSLDMKEQQQAYTDVNQKQSLSTLCIACLTVVLTVTSGGLPFIHGIYMMTIAEKGHFKVSVTRAAEMASVYWLMCFFGRLLSVICSLFTRQVIIMYTTFTGALLAFGFLTLSYYQSEEIIFWIGSFLGGLFSAPGYPTIMAWCREQTPLTPVLVGALIIAIFVGNTVLPFIAGYLISSFGEVSEGYYVTGIALLQLLVFILAHVISTA